MPFCTFQDPYALFDCTPLENLYIQEYMLRAPGDFVKVYIYGLMQCYHPAERMSLAAMAKDLGMEEDAVFRAFQYWERQGAVRRVGDNPPAYAYKNLKQAQLTASTDPSQDLYRYREFNEELRSLFDKKRRLYEQDYQRIYDWMEILELPQEVVLMLIRHCIDLYGIRFSFEKADALAREWAQGGVTTIEDVEEMTRSSKQMKQDLRRVLRRLGQRREPSQDEEALFNKWVRDWGFTAVAVLEACRETTKGTPTMAYLDGILSRQHKLGTRDAGEIAARLTQEQQAMAPARELLAQLGRRSVSPTEHDVSVIALWQQQGFEWDAILLAAQVAHHNGGNSLDSVGQRLDAWRQRGLFTRAAAEDYLRAVKRDNGQLQQIYEAAGVEARPSAADRRLLHRWQDDLGMPQDVLLLAAAYAVGAKAPMPFIDKILGSWNAAGIHDAASARAEHDRRGAGGAPAAAGAKPSATRPVREVAKHRYEQRTYSEDELDALFFDIMKDEDGGNA